MQEVDDWSETDLAWELAAIAPRCTPAIGAGPFLRRDWHSAIDHANVPVSPALLGRLADWLNAYAYHHEAPRLREILDSIRSVG
jgi:hypothetical protein